MQANIFYLVLVIYVANSVWVSNPISTPLRPLVNFISETGGEMENQTLMAKVKLKDSIILKKITSLLVILNAKSDSCCDTVDKVNGFIEDPTNVETPETTSPSNLELSPPSPKLKKIMTILKNFNNESKAETREECCDVIAQMKKILGINI